jgi:hypothetical protein
MAHGLPPLCWVDPSATWCWAGLPLPWAGAKPAPPRGDTWRLGCLPLRWVRSNGNGSYLMTQFA